MMNKKNLSIKQIFSQANKLMFALAVIPLVVSVLLYSRQIVIYQNTLNNIQQANTVAAKADEEVVEEMWDIVTGQLSLAEFNEHNILDSLKEDIQRIQANTRTSQEASILDVALRTLKNLENYQAQIVDNISLQNSYEKNTEIMTQVNSINQLLSEILQEFVRIEINLASQTNKEMIHSLIILSMIELLVLLGIIYFVQKNRKFLNEKVQIPLDHLITMAHELSKGHLGYRLNLPDTPELSILTESLNKMADDLSLLLEENALKQYHLAQSEVRVLQAQITPHFIYNSLDAILSLIEQERYPEASKMTFALSDFFRISLSKGKDWIPLETEIRHVEDYLMILKIRYGEMLTYQIDIPESLKQRTILKMILQPIIENAVYHGTKFVRKVGNIHVSVQEMDDNLIFIIEDNGIGIKKERLQEIQEELAKGLDSEFITGYGLSNVNKRLLIYYGNKAGIHIESQYKKGTKVTVIVSKREEDTGNV